MTLWSLSMEEEHLFWLANLQDHACFILDRLSLEEDTWLEIAEQYRGAFGQLLEEARRRHSRQPNNQNDSVLFSRRIQATAYGYYRFEGHMQHLRLHHRVDLHVPPSSLNSTLNENQEYLRLLYYWSRGEGAPALPLADLTGLWLESLLEAAVRIIRMMDEAERILVRQATHLKHRLQAHLAKNSAIRGYLRFTSPGFPLQLHFAEEIAQTVRGLADFTAQLAQLHHRGTVLNSACSRMLLHAQPEIRYFLSKLAAYVPHIQP